MIGNKARCISFLGLQMGFTWLSNAVPPQCSEHHARKAGALTQSYTHFQVTLQSFYQENYPDDQGYLCVSVVVPFLFLSTDLSTSLQGHFFCVRCISHVTFFIGLTGSDSHEPARNLWLSLEMLMRSSSSPFGNWLFARKSSRLSSFCCFVYKGRPGPRRKPAVPTGVVMMRIGT